MIRLFCRHRHGGEELCGSCAKLFEYAQKRLSKCPYGDDKPQCRNCPIHCYSPAMRERVTDVMRYAGPRMCYTHPVLAMRHLLNRKKPEKPVR